MLSDAPRLECAGLRHTYKRAARPALEDLSFACRSPAVAVLGPNGAGKSTLFRILSTAICPAGGSFVVNGSRVETPDQRDRLRERLGVLPQGFRAFGGYSAEEFLRYVGWLRGMSASETEQRVSECLDQVDLSSRRRDPIRTLSGGMRQRLGLAQALLNEPELLLLDEPTVGLDPEQRATLLGLLAARTLTASSTTLLATHLTEDVAVFADEVVVIADGQLRYSGLLSEFCGAPKGTATGRDVERAYLDCLSVTR